MITMMSSEKMIRSVVNSDLALSLMKNPTCVALRKMSEHLILFST